MPSLWTVPLFHSGHLHHPLLPRSVHVPLLRCSGSPYSSQSDLASLGRLHSLSGDKMQVYMLFRLTLIGQFLVQVPYVSSKNCVHGFTEGHQVYAKAEYSRMVSYKATTKLAYQMGKAKSRVRSSRAKSNSYVSLQEQGCLPFLFKVRILTHSPASAT